MKYRLKDKHLQAAYKTLYPAFDDVLDQKARDQIELPSVGDTVFLSLRPAYVDQMHELSFPVDMIEAVPPFNPDTWNEWPLVKPTEGSIFRVEIYTEAKHDGPEYTPEKVIYRGCATFDGRNLSSFDINIIDERRLLPGTKVRYRPWED